MDRKKIYVGIIIVCFLATAVILYMNFSGGSSTPPESTALNQSTTTSAGSDTDATAAAVVPTAGGQAIYRTPAVFPDQTKFDWSFLQSTKYQALTANPGVTLDPSEIGRQDPFKPY